MRGEGEPEKEKIKILRGYKTVLDLNNRQRSHCRPALPTTGD
jgi:hypothetical protein